MKTKTKRKLKPITAKQVVVNNSSLKLLRDYIKVATKLTYLEDVLQTKKQELLNISVEYSQIRDDEEYYSSEYSRLYNLLRNKEPELNTLYGGILNEKTK